MRRNAVAWAAWAGRVVEVNGLDAYRGGVDIVHGARGTVHARNGEAVWVVFNEPGPGIPKDAWLDVRWLYDPFGRGRIG